MASLSAVVIESGNWLLAIVSGSGAGYSLARAYHNDLTGINAEILRALGIGLLGLSIYFAWFAFSRHTAPDNAAFSAWDLSNRHYAVPLAAIIFTAGMLEVIHLIEDNTKITRVLMLVMFVAAALTIGFW